MEAPLEEDCTKYWFLGFWVRDPGAPGAPGGPKAIRRGFRDFRAPPGTPVTHHAQYKRKKRVEPRAPHTFVTLLLRKLGPPDPLRIKFLRKFNIFVFFAM